MNRTGIDGRSPEDSAHAIFRLQLKEADAYPSPHHSLGWRFVFFFSAIVATETNPSIFFSLDYTPPQILTTLEVPTATALVLVVSAAVVAVAADGDGQNGLISASESSTAAKSSSNSAASSSSGCDDKLTAVTITLWGDGGNRSWNQ